MWYLDNLEYYKLTGGIKGNFMKNLHINFFNFFDIIGLDKLLSCDQT